MLSLRVLKHNQLYRYIQGICLLAILVFFDLKISEIGLCELLFKYEYDGSVNRVSILVPPGTFGQYSRFLKTSVLYAVSSRLMIRTGGGTSLT